MQKPRKKGGQTADAWSEARSKSDPKQGVPTSFKGFVKLQRANDVRLDDAACKRVREAWETGGESKAMFQEQLEWLRFWLGCGALEPKDALTAFRGLSKTLETMKDDGGGAVSVTVVRAPAQPPSTGDDLQVH